MKRYLILVILLLANMKLLADEEIKNENNDKETLFEIQQKEEKQKIEQYEIEQRNYEILNHDFYENEKIRVYNNTIYQFENTENKMMSDQADILGLQDFAISFGYGTEFKLDDVNKVGYEYVSSFPYDRGQIIRLFWSKRF